MLASAEQVLATSGVDDFTMASVASHSGVSVGGIYRRFDGKEQLLAALKDRLLGRLEEDLAGRLSAADHCLAGIVSAFTHAIADGLGAGSGYFPELLTERKGPLAERGVSALAETRRLFEQAAAPYVGEVRRSNPTQALAAVERTVVGACVHFAAAYRDSPDGVSWALYGDQLCDMALAYLQTPDHPTPTPSGPAR